MDLIYNHTVQIDTMYLERKPVLHMVDQATHFCSAVFFKFQSSDPVWRSIVKC